MRRIILTIAAVAVAGLLSANADLQAGPKGGKGSSGAKSSKGSKGSGGATKGSKGNKGSSGKKGSSSSHHDSHHRHSYHRDYRGWSRYCWFPSYGCYGFYDPAYDGWYYWYEPAGEFQPIEMMTTNAPTTNGAAMLPPGAVEIPMPGTTSASANSKSPPTP